MSHLERAEGAAKIARMAMWIAIAAFLVQLIVFLGKNAFGWWG